MPIADLPPGEWSALLIGDEWPNSSALEVMFSAANARQKIAFEHEQYADLLRGIGSRHLAPLEGATAEDTQGAFKRGETNAREIAQSNLAKSRSYANIHRHVAELRTNLRELAADGNSRIDVLNKSKRPLPEKISEILDIVMEIRSVATVKAGSCAGEIYSEIQGVLAIQGMDAPPRVFAADNGVGSATGSAVGTEELRKLLGNKLEHLDAAGAVGQEASTRGGDTPPVGITNTADIGTASSAPPSTASSLTDAGTIDQALDAADAARLANNAGSSVTSAGTIKVALPPDAPTDPLLIGGSALANAGNSQSVASAVPSLNTSSAPSAASTDPANATSLIGTAPSTSTARGAAPTAPPTIGVLDTAGPPSRVGAEAPLSPGHVAENFNAGSRAGAPVSSSAEAISTVAASPVHAAPPLLSTPLAETGTPAAPAFETAHAVATPAQDVTHLATPPTEFTPAVVAPTPAAIAPTLPPPAAGPLAMPPTPPSSLLAYGADLRPPVATTAVVPPMSPSAAPGSAPINPASGSAPAGQPAVVRQQPTAPTALSTPTPGLTERAVAATATGAAAGALAGRAAAESRLERLLAAVAQQQPELNWAIGDLDDGSTVLVTDLTAGWIPPNIEIPTGVRLLQPADRRGGLAALLGPTTHSAVYQPGQYLGPVTGGKPVATSLRARDTAAVDDLGWELAQATRWRDGLPRLAHTLAKALSARTGYLDSEAELLRDHLAAVGQTVISRYPRSIDLALVGNWQLLATINALVNDEKTLANYHFAWFRAQVLTREGHR